jgi:phenylalanine-4-hydroxylase
MGSGDTGALYTPVTTGADGTVTVHLGANHPGVHDPVYRARRAAIAEAALKWVPGTPAPHIEYTDEEHEVWRIVSHDLGPKHERNAIRAFNEAKARLALPDDRIPELEEISAKLMPLTGFRYHPAAGLVDEDIFYGSLADGVFHSTQYIRHPSVPLYTPEPDLIHEVIGHANMLADPQFAEVKRLAGHAARRITTPEAMSFLGSVFWFTLEFGVMREDGEVKAYGAGLMSSVGEIEEYKKAEIRPFDLYSMGTLPFDITTYQPVLFAADSMTHFVDTIGGFFASFDDDTPARLAAEAGAEPVAAA